MKEKFNFFNSFLDTARTITDKELQRKYLLAVAEYGLEWKEPDDEMVKVIMVQTKFVIDRSDWISLSASERWKLGGRPKKEFKSQEKAKKLTKANESKQKLTKANESEIEYIDNNILSTNTKVLDTKDNITSNINNLITELKELANELWIAYDSKDERNFSKHILTAKAFGEFAGKLNMTPTEFAKNVMVASVKIWYWKWACSWPKAIYQNYSEVYNLTVSKSRKAAVTSNDWVF